MNISVSTKAGQAAAILGLLCFCSKACARRMMPRSLCVQVKLLVEEGGADVWVRDRWGKTAYDEARRVGATAVAEYLKQIMDRGRVERRVCRPNFI